MTSTESSTQGSASTSLRQFPFFNLQSVKDVLEPSKTPEVFQTTNNISTTAAGQSSILVADLDGFMHLIAAPDFTVTLSWLAQENGRVTHAAFSSVRGVLLSIAEDDTSPFPVLNVWSLAATSKRRGNTPKLLVSGRLQPSSSNRSHPVSALAHTADLAYVSVGFADGSVLVLRHLDQTVHAALATASSSASSAPPAALPKSRLLHSAGNEPITGLHYMSGRLIVVSPSKIVAYPKNGKSGPSPIADTGAALGCSVVWKESDKLVVAKDEALFVYSSNGSREATWAYEGPKLALYTANNYLVVVSPPFAPTAASAFATVRQFAAKNRDRDFRGDVARVSLLDMDHKFIAHSSAFENGVRDIFVQWGRIWVLSHDGKLTKMEELSTPNKLDMLFNKSQYLLALGLASASHIDAAQTADIHRRYADYLYEKGDFDGAMAQFLDTIGHTEPSYVIRKFLDAQRIHSLTSYLEALHDHGLANSAHTSLLLNCYTKLKDTARLDTFLKMSDQTASEPPFDLDTALRATRQAGYFDHAVALAKRYGAHEDYVRLQIEDRQDCEAAVEYIRGMGEEAAERELQRHGKMLLQHLPAETTQLLIDLCCGSLSSPKQGQSSDPKSTPQQTPSRPNGTSAPRQDSAVASSLSSLQPSTSQNDASARVNDLPSPKQFMAHFATQEAEYTRFLKEVLDRRYRPTEPGLDETSQAQARAMHNALLELYLSQAAAQAGSAKAGQLHQQALELLRSDSVDRNQAILVCISARFEPGIVLLYERLGQIEDLFRWRTRASDPKTALAMLWTYAGRHPRLYNMALCWLTADASLLSQHTSDAERILSKIQELGLMKPVEVVKLLSRSPNASVGLAKPYLKACFDADAGEIQSNKALTESYQKEIKEKTSEFEALADEEKPQVFQVSRCSSCGGALDNPSIHFLCKHSYHQRCLPDTEAVDCPLCAREHGLVVEIQRENERFAGQHDVFLSELEESDDPLQTMASLLGRGLVVSKS